MIRYIEIIQSAIDFIEKNLTAPITVEDVSKNCFQSRWHFQRIFRNVTGYSVYTYIKNRRLALAGNDIILSKEKIIDIALKYQYATPESFLRAFTKRYNTTPLKFRKIPKHAIFEKMDVSEKEILSKSRNVKHQEITYNEILFIGKRNRTTMQQRQNEIDIPKHWQEFYASNAVAEIPNKKTQSTMGIYCNWDIDENFDLLTGTEVTSLKQVPTGFVTYRIPPMRYMMFSVEGNTNEEILSVWNYIYGVWMPKTGYERGFADDFDMFDDRFFDPKKPVSEIYIPLR